jgi:hypothetical protein
MKTRRRLPDALSPNLEPGYALGLWLRAYHSLPVHLPHEAEWRTRNVPAGYPAASRPKPDESVKGT